MLSSGTNYTRVKKDDSEEEEPQKARMAVAFDTAIINVVGLLAHEVSRCGHPNKAARARAA